MSENRAPAAALTAKQLGDAGEHLFVGTLMLAGIPATKMPDGWKAFDVIAFPPGRAPVRISVKTRNSTRKTRGGFDGIKVDDIGDWDFLAVVLVAPGDAPRFFVIPRPVAVAAAKPVNYVLSNGQMARRLTLETLLHELAGFEGNLNLNALEIETIRARA